MMAKALTEIMDSYDKDPPRAMQSYLYTGPFSNPPARSEVRRVPL